MSGRKWASSFIPLLGRLLLAVLLGVHQKRAAKTEAAAAHIADVRALAGVDAHMGRQGAATCRLLATDAAFEGLLARVHASARMVCFVKLHAC